MTVISLTERARFARRTVALGAITLGFLGAVNVRERLAPEAQRPAVFQRYMKRWAGALLDAFGTELVVDRQSVPAHVGPRLVVANHRSPLDIAVLLSLFGGHALARDDLATWPVLGAAATRAGTIYVDRSSSVSGMVALRAIRASLERGGSVLVFPEGGTFAGDEVRPFKGGAFAMLRGLDVRIVPVGLAYDSGIEWVDESFAEHLSRVAGRLKTRCAVRIGDAKAFAGSAQKTADALHEDVSALVRAARQDWER